MQRAARVGLVACLRKSQVLDIVEILTFKQRHNQALANREDMAAQRQRTSNTDQARKRREELMARINGGIAIFPAAPTAIRNSDVEHEYRQDTDFYYLTGFEEPSAVAVLAPDHPEHKFVLFVQPKDREREVWTGWRAGAEGAKQDYGADAAFTLDKLDEELPKLAQKADRIYYRFGSDPGFDERLIGMLRQFQRQRQREGTGPTSVIDPAELLHEMRLIKTPHDLELLRRAIDISCEGHLAAMRALTPGSYEYELEAAIAYGFRKNGSPRCGYASIVGSGANATVLHYTANNCRVEDGDLVLNWCLMRSLKRLRQ